jgi:CubicO group peptidase (beta-lactamase class C family)
LLLTVSIPILMIQKSPAQTASSLPDSPPGKQLDAYLTAFNTGKREIVRQFIVTHFDNDTVHPLSVDGITDQQLSLFATSGGYVLRKVSATTSATITALVQEKRTGFWMELRLFLTAEPPEYTVGKAPYNIVGIGLRSQAAPLELLPNKKLTEAEIREKVDTLMSKLAAADIFSGVVYLAKDGKPLYTRAFGLASRIGNLPNRIDTRFNLASITKMFTAVAVAQLVEQGKLSYTDTVGKTLPDYPNKAVAETVTLHHLLSHTSGLIGARALVEKAPPIPNVRTIAEMVRPFANGPLSFPPGQQFDYSNAGFILLGAIIEKASGQSYYDYVREHVFQPAGMTHTDFYELDTDPPNLATGFKDNPKGARLNNIFDLGVKGSPAGGAYSTGEDMVKFHQALIQHKLLKDRSLETLWTGVTEEPDQHSEYGYGAQVDHYNGTRVIWHGGGWPGITNQFDMYTDLGYTLVILSNYDNDPRSIAYKIREWLTQNPSNEKPALSPPPVLTLTAEISKTAVAVGVPITIDVTVRNSGGTAHASIIDMEIKDAVGTKIYQQFTMGQKIETEHVRIYRYSWTPMKPGKYTVDLGAFGPGWSTKYLFQTGAATIVVE